MFTLYVINNAYKCLVPIQVCCIFMYLAPMLFIAPCMYILHVPCRFTSVLTHLWHIIQWTQSNLFVEDIPLCYRIERHIPIHIFVFSQTTIFYYLTYWRQVPVIRPSSGHLYIKFKHFKTKLNKLKNYGIPYDMKLKCSTFSLYLNFM